MALSDAPTHWRLKGRLLPHLHLCDPCTAWRLTLSDAYTHWRPKGRSLPHFHLCDHCSCGGWPFCSSYPLETEGKVSPPPSLVWSLYLWRMTLSDASTHWRPKSRDLSQHPFLCSCEGWPRLIPQLTGGRRVGLYPLPYTVHMVLTVPVEDDPGGGQRVGHGTTVYMWSSLLVMSMIPKRKYKPISKLIIGTKPKCFDVFQKRKSNVYN